MPLTDTGAHAKPAGSAPAERKYRPELQGLRALAAVLVVVYHVWLGRVSGGVDVFFFVSGFLITGQLYRASLRGRIQFRPMWGRMIKRLFPAALTVLLVTMAAAVVLLPEHRWFQTIREVIASALYLENWQLAASSADYFAQHNTASVVQHFWSLSIQGQFYLVWPLFIGLTVLVVRRAGWGMRWSLFVALVLVFVVSLGYSVWLTVVNQPLAYFHSLTRVWEFALGGLLALGISSVTLPRALRIVLGWAGVVGLVSCGLLLQVGTVFPGYAALWPTVSAALVLLAGATGSAVGADRLLASRPLTYLGNLSYALYLWHWPVLLFYLLARDRESVGILGGSFVIGVSLVLSVLTYHLVEKPARDSRIGVTTRWGAYRFGVLTLVPVLIAAGAWQIVTTQRAAFALDLDDPAHPGARALASDGPLLNLQTSIVPPFATLPDQYEIFPDDECTISPRHEKLRICTVEPRGPITRRIVVVGDSHSQQYIAALRPIAAKHNWQIVAVGKGGCALTTDRTWPECGEWNDAAMAEILEMKPDLVVTMATRDVRAGLTEWTPPGYVEQWQRLGDANIPVVAMRDSPRYDFEPSECVQKYGADSPRCARPRAEMLAPEPPYARLAGVPRNVSFVDMSDSICTADKCLPVIGNVLVYLDDNHITAAYLQTMAPELERKLALALGWEDVSMVLSTPPR
ncbi:acyltransferase family protein [Saccharomonospora sp. NPDC046836]|uniref:acyltransferase family protein n=1 Tax=Saccharomonospora sp. NPDC046836 TaxID=3156921 RepID=UPI0033D5EDFA